MSTRQFSLSLVTSYVIFHFIGRNRMTSVQSYPKAKRDCWRPAQMTAVHNYGALNRRQIWTLPTACHTYVNQTKGPIQFKNTEFHSMASTLTVHLFSNYSAQVTSKERVNFFLPCPDKNYQRKEYQLYMEAVGSIWWVIIHSMSTVRIRLQTPQVCFICSCGIPFSSFFA